VAGHRGHHHPQFRDIFEKSEIVKQNRSTRI
jgi:hypothetical protein